MNELTKHRQTALHLAAQQDLPTICSVLLENAVDFAALDENGNNGSRHSFPCAPCQVPWAGPLGWRWRCTAPLGCSPSGSLALAAAELWQGALWAGHLSCR